MKGKSKITAIIGDVHGKYNHYLELCKKYKYTIQVGDMGFNYDPIRSLSPKYHRHFFGNHDSRDVQPAPSWLGTYGDFELNEQQFFFISGGWSLDGDFRRIDHVVSKNVKTWWQNEELSWQELETALKQYTRLKPEIMLSHECPLELVSYVTNPTTTKLFGYDAGVIETKTNIWLQKCFDAWQPKMWLHGHYHTSKQTIVGNTKFISLAELEVYEIK